MEQTKSQKVVADLDEVAADTRWDDENPAPNPKSIEYAKAFVTASPELFNSGWTTICTGPDGAITLSVYDEGCQYRNHTTYEFEANGDRDRYRAEGGRIVWYKHLPFGANNEEDLTP